MFENSGFVGVVLLIFAVQVTFTYVGGRVLRTVGLTVDEWILVIAASSIIVPFDLLRKLVMKVLFPVKTNQIREKQT